MPTVLFIEHDHVSPPGLLGDAFEKCGWDVAEFLVVPAESFDSPAIDVRLPDPLHYDAVVLLGAPWSVYDEALQERWVGEEIGLARQADAEGIPVIGVCFGGQLLAAAHGGRVERAACAEVGWTRVRGCNGIRTDGTHRRVRRSSPTALLRRRPSCFGRTSLFNFIPKRMKPRWLSGWRPEAPITCAGTTSIPTNFFGSLVVSRRAPLSAPRNCSKGTWSVFTT